MAKNEATLLIRIKQAGGEILDKMKVSMSGLASAAAALGTAVVGFGALATKSFRDSEEATNSLNQSMVQQGIYTSDLAKKYGEMATKLESLTTFADEQITSAQSTLQAYVGQREVTEQLTKATLDFATAKKIDLKSAAEAIGKAIGGETNALSRYGVEVDTTADKTTRMAQAIQGLNSKFGGQAEAAAKGLGSLDQLKNALDNVLEKVGERLAPFISFFTVQLTGFAKALQGSSAFASGLDGIILGLTKSFVLVKNAIVGTVEVISTGLAAAVETVSLITQGQFSKAKEMAAFGMDEVGTVIKDRRLLLEEELNAMDMARATADEEKRQQELLLIQQAEANKTSVATEESKKRAEISKKQKEQEIKDQQEKLRAEQAFQSARVNIISATANLITALTGQGSKAAFLAQQAAAFAQAWVATNLAAAQALAVPPAPNFALSGMAQTAGKINMAAIAATTVKGLAEGGIVRATPGGMPAIIGEGGRDEAVIPLDDPRTAERLGGMGGLTVNIYGPVMGDESQAQEFVRAIDRGLLKLRQSNQSVAFEDTF